MADSQLYKLTVQLEDRASIATRNIQRGLDGVSQKAVQAAGSVSRVGESLQQAATVVPRFNMLGASLQQVVRELPAFSMSLNTGFLAISNNLPMLADAISGARRENAALIASGQTAIPVWRQVASSLLSWQTALVLGVTLMSSYGKEIVSFVASQLSLGKGIDAAAESQKQLNDAWKIGVENAQKELTSLKVLYSAATDDTRSRKERLDAVKQLQTEYPAYFENLSNESIMAGDAADAYTR